MALVTEGVVAYVTTLLQNFFFFSTKDINCGNHYHSNALRMLPHTISRVLKYPDFTCLFSLNFAFNKT